MAEDGPSEDNSSRGCKTQHKPSEPRVQSRVGASYRRGPSSFRFGSSRHGVGPSGLPREGRTSPLDLQTWTARFGSQRLFRNNRNKAVADLVNCPDKSRFVRIVAQNQIGRASCRERGEISV